MHSAAVAVAIHTQDDETAASAILALAPPASSLPAGHSAALASAMWTQLDHVDGAASAPAPGNAAAAVSAAEAASAASAAAISATAATASTTTTLASVPPAHSAPEPPSADVAGSSGGGSGSPSGSPSGSLGSSPDAVPHPPAPPAPLARPARGSLIGRELTIFPGRNRDDRADGRVLGEMPGGRYLVAWQADTEREYSLEELTPMLLPLKRRSTSMSFLQEFHEQEQERTTRDEHVYKDRCIGSRLGGNDRKQLPPCVREVLGFGQQGDEQQPWGPLRRPADPEAAPLSNGELMLWLQQSALRTGQVFDSQSIEFDADATLPTARIRIVLILHESMPGAVKYEVQNIGSTIAALLGLLGKVTWSGKHMGVLGESQEDGKRRFILFAALLLYFEVKNDTADLALCRVVVHRFTVVATSLLIGFRLPPAPHKLGVMLTQWDATDQSWHDDSLGVKDTFSSLLPLMHREFDLQREDGGVHTMSMSVGNDAEGSIFESSLIHRGKGAPLPERSLGNSRSASGSKQLPGFDMPENGSSTSTAVRIQSAALHYYGGKNAIRIPLSDKKAQLAHHA